MVGRLAPVRVGVVTLLALLVGGCGGGGNSGGGNGGAPGAGSGGAQGSKATARELTFPSGVRGISPRFSPDGARVAYARYEGSITAVAVMSAAGADSLDVAADGSYLTALTWSTDGTEVIYAGENDIRAVPAGGGSGRQVVNAFAAIGPDLSPDGRSLVYGVNGGSLHLADLGQTPPVILELGSSGSAPRFAPDGNRIAFWRGDKLLIMDLASRATTQLISDDQNTGFGGVDWFRDGERLLAGTDHGIEIVTVGPPVQRQRLANVFALLDVDLSPDERAVAYGINGHESLFVLSGF